MNENRCVACGDIIPEGRQVCLNCEDKADKQIEEMAIVIANYDDSIICELGDCKGCSYNNFGRKCIWLSQAEALSNAGYRKERQGEWIKVYDENNIFDMYRCSCCDYRITKNEFGNRYCPNCGAKMKGAE